MTDAGQAVQVGRALPTLASPDIAGSLDLFRKLAPETHDFGDSDWASRSASTSRAASVIAQTGTLPRIPPVTSVYATFLG